PGNTPTGLLPTGLARGTTSAAGKSTTDSPGTEVTTTPRPPTQNGRADAPHLSVIPAGLKESAPGGQRGHRAGSQPRGAATGPGSGSSARWWSSSTGSWSACRG
ncbi:MAG: hypothetical protein ACRDND_29020, partial [Streptosporangiaceae bacterium]